MQRAGSRTHSFESPDRMTEWRAGDPPPPAIEISLSYPARSFSRSSLPVRCQVYETRYDYHC